jgi:hypothetical protein
MKNFLLLAFLCLSAATMAQDRVVLTCTTAGDAFDAVEFIETSSGNEIQISYLDETVDSYKTERSFKHIKKRGADTFVAEGPNANPFGGSVSDSILVRIFKGASSGRLAANGFVYYLTHCY